MEASKDFPSDKMVKEFEYLAVLDAGYGLGELGRQLEEGKRDMNKEFEVKPQAAAQFVFAREFRSELL
jgi:hypothetical protein